MSNDVIPTLLARNSDFARHRHTQALKMMPSLKTLIIGCVDPRVDPTVVLGLEPGETAVIRNVGGRVTPSAIETFAMLREVTRAAGGDLAAGWNIVVLHHTDCGITRLERAPQLLSGFFGVAQSELTHKAIHDPRESVALDIAALRDSKDMASEVQVTGLVYDVKTGTIEIVVPTSALRA